MLALTWTDPGAIGERIRRTRELTDRPFGVNVVAAGGLRRARRAGRAALQPHRDHRAAA
jgi:hypothetical protein